MLVVDASIAAKWFLDEGDSEEAIGILGTGLKLVAPSLAKYEVASAFIRRVREKEISSEDGLSYRDRWLHAVATNVIRLEEDNRDIIVGGEMAVALGHMLPDCVYLAMSQRLSVPLVTADDQFAKKVIKKKSGKVLSIREALALAA